MLNSKDKKTSDKNVNMSEDIDNQVDEAVEVEAAEENAKSSEEKPKDGCKKKDSKKKDSKKDEVTGLKAEIASLNDKLAKEKDDYLRLMAEFDNYRRRTSEEKLNLIKTAGADTIKGMLTTLDECERAMEMLEKATDIEAAKEGTSLIYNKLLSYLKSKGLEAIPAKGLDFDTDVHEAVTLFPVQDESQKGKVIDVMQTGYKLGDKVIRYAKVIVGQ